MSTVKTRIKLKYDTLENWVANDPVLLEGELALVKTSIQDSNGKETILAKVGNGSGKFSEIGYLWANAADVPSWAKGTEISYSISKDTDGRYNLYNKDGTSCGVITISTDPDFSALVTRVTTLESKPGLDKVGTVTGVKLNSATKTPDNSGIIDLGSIATSTALDDLTTTVNSLSNTVNTIKDTTIPALEETININTSDISTNKTNISTNTAAIQTINNSEVMKSGINATKVAQIETNKQDIAAIKDNISSALHFLGVYDSTDKVTSPSIGDVIIVGKKEYVYGYTDSAKTTKGWTELGDEGSHITKSQGDTYWDAKGTAQGLVDALDMTKVTTSGYQVIESIEETNGKVAVTTRTMSISYNDLTNKPSIDNNNQKVATSDITFGANDTVTIKAGDNITVKGDASAKTITIGGTPSTSVNDLTGAVVIKAGNNVSVTKDGQDITIASSYTDTNTAHSHAAGAGLILTGTGGISGTTTYKVSLADETKSTNTALSRSTVTNRIYPVELDASGNLAVTVPWTDTANNGALKDRSGNTIFTANQATDTTIELIDCGSSSEIL
jgi:hypothetical protein